MRSHGAIVLVASVIAATAAKTNAQDVITVPMGAIGRTCRVLGRTGEPLGIMATLHGIVVKGDRFHGDWWEPILQVQKINGRASQGCIEVPMRPYAAGFGEPYYAPDLDAPYPPKPDPERSLPRLEYGQTYEFRGYETGRFVGAPDEAGCYGGIAKEDRGFYFTSEFLVVKGKKARPIAFSPADFMGQKVLVHGKAINHDGKAWLMGQGWLIEVLGIEVWSESILNARVAVTGVLGKERNAKLPHITRDRVRRDHLEDQIGLRVELRGQAREFDSRWYLRHNGQNVLVENMNRMAADKSLDLHAPIEVRGVLRRERLRDEVFGSRDDEPEERYIVRDASCGPVNDLLPIERVEEPCPWSIGATPPGPSAP